MKKDMYFAVWNEIRLIEADEMDFVLANGNGNVKTQICEYFLENEILNDYYILHKDIDYMCNKYGYTKESMYSLIRIELYGVKVVLAEEGIFEDVDFGENQNYYDYIRLKIGKNGIMSLFYNDEISYSDLAKAIGVSAVTIRRTINNYKNEFKNILKDLNLCCTKECLKLYIYVFDGKYKCFEDIPFKYLELANDFIKNDDFLYNVCMRNYKYSGENQQKYEQIRLDMRQKFRKIIEDDCKIKKSIGR